MDKPRNTSHLAIGLTQTSSAGLHRRLDCIVGNQIGMGQIKPRDPYEPLKPKPVLYGVYTVQRCRDPKQTHMQRWPLPNPTPIKGEEIGRIGVSLVAKQARAHISIAPDCAPVLIPTRMIGVDNAEAKAEGMGVGVGQPVQRKAAIVDLANHRVCRLICFLGLGAAGWRQHHCHSQKQKGASQE
ncbi:MAG: hypothetical protein JJ949_17805 [Roseicyclus sp.]|nr:hypothetical protein [Roseicyclus sp.]